MGANEHRSRYKHTIRLMKVKSKFNFLMSLFVQERVKFWPQGFLIEVINP